MISAGAPQEYVPHGRVLLPLHHKEAGLQHDHKAASMWTSAETESSRDLFRALKAVSLNDVSPVHQFIRWFLSFNWFSFWWQKESWCLRDCSQGEEELYFSDNIVMWSRNDGNASFYLIKTFTLENKISQSIWCQFKEHCSNSYIESICIVDNVSLQIFTHKGDHYPVALPFQVLLIDVF